jgi:hypothetical protein
MAIHELAGKPAPRSLLANIPRLVTAYYAHKPDVSDPTQPVAFGTSGHRGSSLKNSFNEEHILAVSQAICDHRKSKRIDDPRCFKKAFGTHPPRSSHMRSSLTTGGEKRGWQMVSSSHSAVVFESR